MITKFFSSQQDDEKVEMVIRRHWFVMVPSLAMAAFIYLFGILGVLVFPFVFPALVSGLAYNIYVISFSLIFLFNTGYLFSIWLMYHLNVDIITTEHVVEIDQESLFSRKISELGLEKIQDVTSSQRGLTKTMFNYGDVDIQTAGELPNFIFKSIPNPNYVAQRVMELEEAFAIKRNGSIHPITPKAHHDKGPDIEYPSQ